MPGKSRVSFRILQPDPFDLHRHPDIPLLFAALLPTQTQSAHFKNALLGHATASQISLRSDHSVRWRMTLSAGTSFAKKIADSFPGLALQMEIGLKGYSRPSSWTLSSGKGWKIRWANKTQVMGILNVTPDSFSDGGRFLDPAVAVEQALRMQQEGADWIDVGGESTRPGAKALPVEDEKKRILPVLRACVKVLKVPLSVDTYKAETAKASVGEGARLVNDIGALRMDPQMGKTLARLKVPVVLMHMKGRPRVMQKNPRYQDVIGEIISFFRERLRFAQECGIHEDRIILDPGFGFGKTPWHNLELTRRLWEFKVLGRPLLLGPSRKSTLGTLLGGAPPEERVEGTAAAVTAAILKGADFVRVHDVKTMARVVKIADAIRYQPF